MSWTHEELEAMRLFDEKIDTEDTELTIHEIRESERRDREASLAPEKEAQLRYQRKYQRSQKYKDAQRRWYQKNKEKVLSQAKAYRESHAEQIRKTKADWYQRNKERIRAQQKAYGKKVKAERIAHEN